MGSRVLRWLAFRTTPQPRKIGHDIQKLGHCREVLPILVSGRSAALETIPAHIFQAKTMQNTLSNMCINKQKRQMIH